MRVSGFICEITESRQPIRRPSFNREFVLRKVFKALDKDGSGTLSRTEIEDATKKEKGLDISADKIAVQSLEKMH